ncbi:hypothetical protein BJ741DRAFT_601204 [Chytriomyces cf. hyalinus JEL632]|nr:hypothetical protein BJ741DRAFT_601204 [Chytriomyces cf. hyalinus JEL632]
MCQRNRPQQSLCNSSTSTNQHLVLPLHNKHPQQSPCSQRQCHSMRRSASFNPMQCGTRSPNASPSSVHPLLSPLKLVKNQILQITQDVQDLFACRKDGVQTMSKDSRVGKGEAVNAPVSVQDATAAGQEVRHGVQDTAQHMVNSGTSIRTQATGADVASSENGSRRVVFVLDPLKRVLVSR